MRNLKGRVAVVTGGANGIGKGLTIRFLDEGMKVVIADNDAGDLENAVTELSTHGEVLGVPTDVADADSVQALADAAVARFGAVHVLCNNAGVGGAQHFSTIPHATWEWTLGVNLWGVINGCRIFRPILADQEEAYIVNTASMSGFLTGGYLTPYSVSKAGVVALSEGLAFEWATEYPHIGVAVLCPAYTSTSIRHDERNAPAGHIPRAVADPSLIEHQAEVDRTIEQEGMPVSQIADLVVRGMADRKTHIFPHPEWLKLWTDRVERVSAQIDSPHVADRPE
ncbi:SDR family NAD(P)-dependent oxidoreductase [Nocardia fusca]|uniref:SDR family NAD(P)-dependent oxidoreductase n=1 Tax=Nocardia fusca TaxID=941183 RepID=UPI0037C8C84F